ncbi:hypothetical protein EDB19DRAFT_1828922 [Suillus lakei]|nr:hypothetical protein EDB19DRAFT_1828922 [Suillus lakei]
MHHLLSSTLGLPPKLGTENHLSIDTLADRIIVKLEEKMMASIEQQLVMRVVDALMPVLEMVIKEAMKALVPQQPAVVLTNNFDFNDIYALVPTQDLNEAHSWLQMRCKMTDIRTSRVFDGSEDIGTITDNEPLPPPPNQLALKQKNKDSALEHNSLTALAKGISSGQMQAVMSTLKQETDIIAMLRTGGRKFMLAIIPAIMEIKKVVVLKGMCVPFQVYDQSHPLNTNINLILVSVDKAKFKTWRQSLVEFNEILPVSRLIFDEAHLPLLSDVFRESMQDMHELRQFPMQFILLSGTIPQSNIATLKKAFGMASNTIEIRESTNHPELEYIMKMSASSNTLESKAIQIMEHEQERWTSKDRGLIFVMYMQDGETLLNKCHKDWWEGRSPVMICMSAFSTGNDYPHIRLVIHLKTPLEMSEIIHVPKDVPTVF